MRYFTLSMLGMALFIPAVATAERIGVDDLPPAVAERFRQDHPEAREVEIDKESHFGLTLYEIKVQETGEERHQTLYDSEGKPFGHEEPVAPDALPPQVKQSIEKMFTSMEIEDVEAIHHPDGKQVEYEVDVEGDGSEWEITLNSEGKVLTVERD